MQLVQCHLLIPIGIILYEWNHIFAKLAMSNNKTMECILISSSKPRADSINSKCTDADQRYIKNINITNINTILSHMWRTRTLSYTRTRPPFLIWRLNLHSPQGLHDLNWAGLASSSSTIVRVVVFSVSGTQTPQDPIANPTTPYATIAKSKGEQKSKSVKDRGASKT